MKFKLQFIAIVFTPYFAVKKFDRYYYEVSNAYFFFLHLSFNVCFAVINSYMRLIVWSYVSKTFELLF